MSKKYRYAIQSPFISLIKIDNELKKEIINHSWRVWQHLFEETQYLYYPVLTIFTKEISLRYLKLIVEEYEQNSINIDTDLSINRDLIGCVEFVYELLKKYFKFDIQIEKNTDSCQDWKKILMYLIHLILREREKNNDLKDFLNEFVSRNLRDGCRGLIQDFFREPYNIDQLIDFLEYLIQNICIKRPIFRPQRGNKISKLTIAQIYEDIHKKYGCYTPPSFWEYLEKRPFDYNLMLKILGIPDNVQLFDQPCVFIYPFLVDLKAVNIEIESGVPKKDILRDLFILLLIHEHGHALLRHGIHKTGNKDGQWCSPSEQRIRDKDREVYPWIEEGLVMYLEFKYIEEVLKQEPDKSIYDVLLEENRDYVLKNKDPNVWPYYGQDIIGGCIYKTSEKLNSLISNWKQNVRLAANKLEANPHRLFDLI